MKKHRNGSTAQEEEDRAAHRKKSKRQEEEGTGSEDDSSGSDGENYRSKRKRRRHHSSKREHRRRGRSSGRESEHSASSDSCSESDTEESGSQLESETSKSEDEARRRRREKRKRHEREYEERRRRKEKDRRKRRKMEKEEKMKKRKDKKKKEAAKKGAVTNSWGKYGIIKEVDMWNKRPEFTAWLAEVKQVNLETLSNREEKQMFKEFMEDHNTATFPSKKYYNLDAYHRHKIEKEMKKGPQRIQEIERSVFNDEEQRRIELLRERERQKEEQVEALKRSMQGGMAQAMKEQSRLKEEMMYQYKLGNYEAAAAIQRRLDPDVAM